MKVHEAISPGSGRRAAARSWLRSDAPSLDLSGEWKFRLSPVANPGDQPWEEDYDDGSWDLLPVPSHWVLHEQGRYGRPIYTNLKYPFPLDPPHVPDTNPTGDHRYRFVVPQDWDGLTPGGRTLLRLDGAESMARVWLNGQEVGTTTGSRLVQEFDVTDLLRHGENLVAIRVHQWSAGSYVEDQDQWWLPGIFREVTLLARPSGALDDVWLRADFDHTTSTGRLTPEIRAGDDAFPVTLRVEELGVEVTWTTAQDVDVIDLPEVEPWSSDAPRLYDIEVSSAGETVRLRTGFRTVRIAGQQVLVNGRPLRLRGVNRHEVDRRQGRVFDRERARQDLLLMKRHHVDAIRTAHYPPHPELLELTDELGFWVMDECDLETHGFELSSWVGNPADDPQWREVLLDRAQRFLERDKNHPSIIFWSLGNESATGQNLAAMAQWIRHRDPSRPIHYEGDHAGEYTDIYSRMYPALEEIDAFFEGAGPVAAAHHAAGKVSAAAASRVRRMPYVLCEYLHAMGTGAGGAAEHIERMDRNPGHLGGFVWEWRDHALLDDDGNLAYGGDFGEEVHDGNFVCDGLVMADSTPTSGLLDWAAHVAPVRVRRQHDRLVVTNQKHAAPADVLLTWRIEQDGTTRADGELTTGPVPAGEERHHLPPTELSEALGQRWSGDTWLTLELRTTADTPWEAAGTVIHRWQEQVATPRPRPASPSGAEPRIEGDLIVLGGAHFQALTGDLISLEGRAIAGPVPELWRAPTDNDEGHGPFDYEVIAPIDALTGAQRGPSSADRWRRIGLDRLQRRTVAVELRGPELVVRYRSAPSAAPVAIDTELRYTWGDDGLQCAAGITPVGPWTGTWPRLSLRFLIPGGADEVTWFGTGPGESYPDMRAAVHVGVFTAPAAELLPRQIHPQESGHRSDLRSLALTTEDRDRLHLEVDPSAKLPGFTLTPWTSQQLARTTHHHLLPASGDLYLYLDLAQNGLGSRSCGPGVRPEHMLTPQAMSVRFTLRTAK